ncbi:type III pantothenate kinase [Ravibacter arvi]|uniref:Type III pantothenate kinase n=1 Tax=Ravibacter arvi TaxID=2051041 RepID=A0ABP8LUQ9_9BACT
MLLAVDIGNTDVVFGVFQSERPVSVWRTPTLSRQPAYHYETYLKFQMLESGISASGFDKIVVSSVVPVLTPAILDLLKNLTGVSPILVGADSNTGLSLEIDHPYQLGSDLIANAVAAHARFRQNCIVVDFGTALTFTAVTADGRVLGVAIVPGLKTAVKALFANTAQLPEVPLTFPETAIGKNTTHSIQAGILMGYEGLVRSLLARFREEMGAPCVAIATGGLSSIIGPLQPEFAAIDQGLTLDGLRIIGGYPQP